MSRSVTKDSRPSGSSIGASAAAPETTPVLMVGYDPASLEIVAERLGERCELVSARGEKEVQGLIAGSDFGVVSLGVGVAGDRACRLLTELVLEHDSSAIHIVFAAGANPDIFRPLIIDREIFYLSRQPPDLDAQIDLIRTAALRHAARSAGEGPSPSQRRASAAVEPLTRMALQSDIGSLAELLVEATEISVPSARCCVVLHEPNEDLLWTPDTALEQARRGSAAVGLTSFTLRSSTTVRLARVADDPRYDAESDNPGGSDRARFLAVALRWAGRTPFGVVTAVRTDQMPEFTVAETTALEELCLQASPYFAEHFQEQETRATTRTEGAPPSLFRSEAIRDQIRGQSKHGDPLRMSSSWAGWIYSALILILIGLLGYLAVAEVDVYASGVAVVRTDATGGRQVVALLPAEYLARLEPGLPLRLELQGFANSHQEVEVTSVGERVIGPAAARRLLGPEFASTVGDLGPVVVAESRLPGAFEFQGRKITYSDGMLGTAYVLLGSERILVTLFPALQATLEHADG